MKDYAKIIGQRLKEARKNLRLSQQDMGEYLKLSHVAYGDYERGEALPNINTLLEMSMILERPITYFLGLEENGAEVAKDKLNKMGDHPDIEQISEIWEYLDAAERRNVYDYIRWRLSQQLQRFNSSEKRDRDADKRTMAITDIMFFSHEFSPVERARLITYLQDLDNSSSGAV